MFGTLIKPNHPMALYVIFMRAQPATDGPCGPLRHRAFRAESVSSVIISVYIHASTYILHMYIIQTHKYTDRYIHMCMYTYIYIYVYVCVYTYIYPCSIALSAASSHLYIERGLQHFPARPFLRVLDEHLFNALESLRIQL